MKPEFQQGALQRFLLQSAFSRLPVRHQFLTGGTQVLTRRRSRLQPGFSVSLQAGSSRPAPLNRLTLAPTALHVHRRRQTTANAERHQYEVSLGSASWLLPLDIHACAQGERIRSGRGLNENAGVRVESRMVGPFDLLDTDRLIGLERHGHVFP